MTGPRSGALPPGWPAEVPPPGTPEWERRAVTWLYDACPPDYRAYDVLRRHPAVLARCAAWHVAAAREATRHGIANARVELREVVGVETVDAAVAALEREQARLAALGRAVDVVERALRGERWTPRL